MKVLVTGATSEAGIAAINVLAGNGYKIIGADERKVPLNLYSRYTEKPYYFYSMSEKDGFAEAVINIIKKEKPDVVLPIKTESLIAKYRREIERHTRLLISDYESIIVANDKKATISECKMIGIYCPEIFTEKEAILKLKKNKDKINPVKIVLKPRGNIGGGHGLYIVDDVESFTKAKIECENAYGEAVIEEYIPGDTDSMRTVNLIFDKKSKLVAYFTTKKIRQWPNTGGISVLSISTDEWELVNMVLPFFRKWRWQGPAEVELKIDTRDGNPKLIEINPRFWGYLGFPIRCGVNFPMIACELANGFNNQYREYPEYTIGVKYINPLAYTKSVMSDLIHGKISSVSKIFTELRGKKVLNNLIFDDPLPIMAKNLLKLKTLIASRKGPETSINVE